MEFNVNKTVINLLAEVAITKATVFALKDVFLKTQEQKDVFKEKIKHYSFQISVDIAKDLGIENPEEFVQELQQRISEK